MTECLKCHGYDYFTIQWLTRNLFIDEVYNDDLSEPIWKSTNLRGILEMLRMIWEKLTHTGTEDIYMPLLRMRIVVGLACTTHMLHMRMCAVKLLLMEAVFVRNCKSSFEKKLLLAETNLKPYNITCVDKNFYSIMQHCRLFSLVATVVLMWRSIHRRCAYLVRETIIEWPKCEELWKVEYYVFMFNGRRVLLTFFLLKSQYENKRIYW